MYKNVQRRRCYYRQLFMTLLSTTRTTSLPFQYQTLWQVSLIRFGIRARIQSNVIVCNIRHWQLTARLYQISFNICTFWYVELTDALKIICVFYVYISEINLINNGVCNLNYASHNQRLPLLLEDHSLLTETKKVWTIDTAQSCPKHRP